MVFSIFLSRHYQEKTMIVRQQYEDVQKFKQAYEIYQNSNDAKLLDKVKILKNRTIDKNELINLADSAGVSLIAIDDSKNKGNISFQVQGGFLKIVEFMNEIQNNYLFKQLLPESMSGQDGIALLKVKINN